MPTSEYSGDYCIHYFPPTIEEAYCTSGFSKSGRRIMRKSGYFEKQAHSHEEWPYATHGPLVDQQSVNITLMCLEFGDGTF